MGSGCLGVGAALAAISVGTTAQAGAWIVSEEGQEIVTVAYGRRDALSYSESDVYWEKPRGERLAVVTQTRLEYGPVSEEGWRGDAAVGAKYALMERPGAAAAVQAAAVWRSDPIGACGEGGGEVRAMGGLSRRAGFVNVEAATQLHPGGCARQRLDLTTGYRFAGRWLTLGQAFLNVDPDGGRTIKAQASLVRFGPEERGLQLGLRVRIDGNEREPALVLGWWGAPRS